MYKLSYKGFINAVAGTFTGGAVTASHNNNGYLVVAAIASGSVPIPQFSKILAGTNFSATGLVITLPKLTATPNHAITVATSGTIFENAITLSFSCTGYMSWVNGASVTITGMTPDGYNGTYNITGVTSNTAFTVSKSFNGDDGAAGLANGTVFGTASMVISSTHLGLYKTNLTSTIPSASNLTFTLPNFIPAGTQAISIFSTTALLADIMFFNKVSNQLESIALPTQEPYRMNYFSPDRVGEAIYESTAVSGTSFIKAIFWAVA